LVEQAQRVLPVPELTDSLAKLVAPAKLAALVKPAQQVPKVSHSMAQWVKPGARDQPATRDLKVRQE